MRALRNVTPRRSLTSRERYAIGVAIGFAALLVGIALVWPPGAWIVGGLGMTGVSLVGLAGVRGSR